MLVPVTADVHSHTTCLLLWTALADLLRQCHTDAFWCETERRSECISLLYAVRERRTPQLQPSFSCLREAFAFSAPFGVMLRRGQGLARTACTWSIDEVMAKYELEESTAVFDDDDLSELASEALSLIAPQIGIGKQWTHRLLVCHSFTSHFILLHWHCVPVKKSFPLKDY